MIRLISTKKNEPEWHARMAAEGLPRVDDKMAASEGEPKWANLKIAPIDYQSISYYSAPKKKEKLGSMDEVDPELRATFDKLGISPSTNR